MVAGNGFFGIMQYGEPRREAIVFNCHEFLYPNGAPEPVPDMSDQLGPMQDRMLEGKIGEGCLTIAEVIVERVP